MHPEIASFLAEHQLEERPACRTLRCGAPEGMRNIFLPRRNSAKIQARPKESEHRRPLSHSPISPLRSIRDAWRKPITSNTERRRKLSSTRFFQYKKRIFPTKRALSARRPASRSAESAIPSLLRFLGQTEPSARPRGRVLPVSVECSRQSTAQTVSLANLRRDKGVGCYLPPSSVLDSRCSSASKVREFRAPRSGVPCTATPSETHRCKSRTIDQLLRR